MDKELLKFGDLAVEQYKSSIKLLAGLIFKQVLVPVLKEWNLYLDWAMGSATFHDRDGFELDEYDKRISEAMADIDKLCERYEFFGDFGSQGLCNILMEIRCTGKTNGERKVIKWGEKAYSDKNPPTRGEKRCFCDLKRGDSIFFPDYLHEDIRRVVVLEVSDSVSQVQLTLDREENPIVLVKSLAKRHKELFTDRETALRSAELLYKYL